MITSRDKEVFKFLEKYRAISSQQAKYIFFDGLESSSIRRLNKLEEIGALKSYAIGKNKVYSYNEAKEISEHDLLILDFYAWIYKQGGKVIEFIKEPKYFNGLLRPDGLIKFEIPYHDKLFQICAFLEVDFKHYTENTKISTMYTKLYNEEVLKEFCGDMEFPLVIIARPTPGIRYNSNLFTCIYTDLRYMDLLKLIFKGRE